MSTQTLRDFYQNKTVLITGATGFKGSWLAHTLLSFGAKVVGFSLDPITSRDIFVSTNLAEFIGHQIIDVRDFSQVNAYIAEAAPDVVFHLAAQPIVRRGYDEPLLTMETNVLGTVNVLEAIRRQRGVQSAVIVTTDKVYQDRGWVYGYRENDSLGGYDPYSGSKAAADLVTQTYVSSYFNPKSYGVKHQTLVGIARTGNVIGGGDWSPDRLVPDIMRAVYLGDGVVTLRNPGAVRPWEHVLEPVSGYLLLAMRLAAGETKLSGSWNFGPEEKSWVAVGEVTERVLSLLGKGKLIVQPEIGMHETELLTLDVTKARRKLDWSSRWSIDQTLKAVTQWYDTVWRNPGSAHQITTQQINSYFNERGM